MKLNFYTFKNENFVCSNCGWQGKGSELATGNFSEEHAICNLECPSCLEYIGFWQAPLNEEAEKSKKENPDL